MNSRWAQAGLAGLLLALIGLGAWLSVPRRPDRFVADQLARNRRFLFWEVPQHASAGIVPDEEAVRLGPGMNFEYDIDRLAGRLLKGSFRATAPAVAELALVDQSGRREVLLRRALDPAGAASGFFVIDPSALPAGTRRIALGVPPDSPAAVDWRPVQAIPRAGSSLPPVLPFAFIAYEGFTDPFGEKDTFFTHAPSQLLLAVSSGPQRLALDFGFNPDLFNQAGHASDGLVFRARLESPAGPKLLWEVPLDYRSRPQDRSIQHAVIEFSPPAPTRLRLEVEAGPAGRNSWDWAVWRNLQSVSIPAR